MSKQLDERRKKVLCDLICYGFDEQEIETELCPEVNIPYDKIAVKGATNAVIVWKLIEYCLRRDLISTLIVGVHNRRSNLNVKELFSDLLKDPDMKKFEWLQLQEEYLETIREEYELNQTRGLAPQVPEKLLELPLSKVYVQLPMRLRLPYSMEYEVHPLELISGKQEVTTFELDTTITQKQAERIKDKEQARIKLSEQSQSKKEEEGSQATQKELPERTVDIWEALAYRRLVVIGDAGAGKSTLIHHLALSLARGVDTKVDERFEGWLPIVKRLTSFAGRLESEPSLRLADYICQNLSNPKFDLFLKRCLDEGKCFILLDGFDEVSNPDLIAEHIHAFTLSFGRNNCVVVTSREYAIRNTPIGPKFEYAHLQPMSGEYINRYIDNWYEAYYTKYKPDELEEPQNLKEALQRDSSSAELAKTPLMLEIIIRLYRHTGRLFTRQIDLYQAITDTLVEHWPRHHKRSGMDQLREGAVKRILMPIAYEMLTRDNHIGQVELHEELVKGVKQTIWGISIDEHKIADDWMSLIIRHSGLLVKKSVDNEGMGVFEFWHRRLCEYLAGCYLAERWGKDDFEFVFGHLHQAKWNDIVILCVAQLGIQSTSQPSKALTQILGWEDEWEKIVWRNYLFAGRCLAKDMFVEVDVSKNIIKKLVHLITSPEKVLRKTAIEILASLSSLPTFRIAVIDEILEISAENWPEDIRLSIAAVLLKIGERERSCELLKELRNTAYKRGDSRCMTEAVRLLLEGKEEDILRWLIGVAEQYTGTGLILYIFENFVDTKVAAADQSFGAIPIGNYLTEDEFSLFIEDFLKVVTSREEQERARWIQCQLGNPELDEVQRFTDKEIVEQVRRLAAQWLLKHGEHEEGIRVLEELATRNDGNLQAVKALVQFGESSKVIKGLQTTIQETLYEDEELEAISRLKALDEETDAITITIEIMLARGLREVRAFHSAESLLYTPAQDVGLAALRVISLSLQHYHRYEAAEMLGKMGFIEEAYQVLLDIIHRWDAYESDRVKALIELKKPIYSVMLDQTSIGIDLDQLAGAVIEETTDIYWAVSRLLEGPFAPNRLKNNKTTFGLKPTISESEWAGYQQKALTTFYGIVLEWLQSQEKTNPYVLASLGYLQKRDDNKSALNSLREAAKNPGVSSQLLFRISAQLKQLSRKDYLAILNEIPNSSYDQATAWLRVADLTQDPEDEVEKALALNALEKVLAETSSSDDRRLAYLLRFKLGCKEDEWQEPLLDLIEHEVPQRETWLYKYAIPGFDRVLSFFNDGILKKDPHFAMVHVNYAVLLHDLNRHKESLDALEKAIKQDKQNYGAWNARAYLQNLLGENEQALSSIKKTLDISAREPDDWHLLGQILTDMGQYNEASSAFDKAIRLSSDNTEREWVCKAEVLRRMGSYGAALEAVNNAMTPIGMHDEEGLLWIVRSEILESMEQYQDALDMLRKGLKEGDSGVRANIVNVLGIVGENQFNDSLLQILKDREEKWELRIRAALALGDIADSNVIADLIQIVMNQEEDLILRRVVTQALGEFDKPEVMEVLLSILTGAKFQDEMRAEAGWSLAPTSDRSTLTKLADVILNKKMSEEVVEGAASALSVTDVEEAVGILEAAIRKRRNMPILYSRLAVLLRRLGRSQEAFKRHNTAIRLATNHKRPYLSGLLSSRAASHLHFSEYEKAELDARAAIALAPASYPAWSYLATSLFEQGKDDRALLAWWRARAKGQRELSASAELAIGIWVVEEKGSNEAIRLWQRALSRESRLNYDFEFMSKSLLWTPRMIKVAQEITQ